MENAYLEYKGDVLAKSQFIFANIFSLANKLQTACEKIQADITMKQWLLLVMTAACEDEPSLTNIGRLMGCSRQNVKKLASPLEEKGYIKMVSGDSNATNIKLTAKVGEYSKKMTPRHMETLNLLFNDFSPEEISTLFDLYLKLAAGVSRVETYGESLDEKR